MNYFTLKINVNKCLPVPDQSSSIITCDPHASFRGHDLFLWSLRSKDFTYAAFLRHLRADLPWSEPSPCFSSAAQSHCYDVHDLNSAPSRHMEFTIRTRRSKPAFTIRRGEQFSHELFDSTREYVKVTLFRVWDRLILMHISKIIDEHWGQWRIRIKNMSHCHIARTFNVRMYFLTELQYITCNNYC